MTAHDRDQRLDHVLSLVFAADDAARAELCRLLADGDAYVREAAAKALGGWRDGAAVEPLIAATRDKRRRVRDAAVLALGRIGDAAAVPALVERVENDEFPPIRISAVTALAAIGHPSAAAALDRLAADSGLAAEVADAVRVARASPPRTGNG